MADTDLEPINQGEITSVIPENQIDATADKLLAAYRSGNQAAFTSELILSAGYSKDQVKGVDLYETQRKIMIRNEREMFIEYQQEFLSNDLAQFLVTHLTGNMMDFKFESDNPAKLKKVEDWFYQNNTHEQLTQLCHNAFVYGTGYAQRWMVGKRLDNVTRIDASSIQLFKDVDRKGNIIYTYRQLVNTDLIHDLNPDKPPSETMKAIKQIDLNPAKVMSWRPIEIQRSPYGVSMMRSSLLPLQAVRQLNMDIPAGIKRLAYESMVLYLDLEGVPEEKQKGEITKALRAFTKYDSATSTIVGLDKRHKLAYVGHDGGGGQKIIPILDVLEPILIFLLNKWHVPLSEVLQEKSNRAVATTQNDLAYKRLNALKRKFARFVEREVVSYILGEENAVPSVRIIHNISFSEVKEEFAFYLENYKAGVLPREFLISKYGVQLPDGELTYHLNKNEYLFNTQNELKTTQKIANPPKPKPGAGGFPAKSEAVSETQELSDD